MLFTSALVAPVNAATSAASSGYHRVISASGTTSFQAAQPGSDVIQLPEFRGQSAEPAASNYAGNIVNRSYSRGNGNGAAANSNAKAKSNPEVNLSFDGLNFRDQRLANGGNQFSVEPPDQGLCAGNGYVLESLNDVLRVYDSAGNAQIGVVDLNTFYGYPAAINRTTGEQGPFVTDPSCLFDQGVQRWFQVVLTLDVNPSTGDFLGTNHLDIAVSQTADPTGQWTIYHVPTQNNGSDGTPDHNCSYGFCFADYPHIGADANGFYISTNEYSFFGPEFKSANIYAFSKSQLASGGPTNLVVLETLDAAAGNPGFTVWPAVTPGSQYRGKQGGTEYFLSSDAAEEANGNGTSSRIFLWSLTNTKSLDKANPALSLTNQAIPVGEYAVPPLSNQKAGPFPLGECINDTTTPTPYGPGCWQYFSLTEPAHNEVISHPDSLDLRMQQVVFANGKVWGALGTAVTVNGENKAGIEYFIVNPSNATLTGSGYLAKAGNNLTMPAVGVTESGRGVIAFTVMGNDYYPSAGYASLDAKVGAGPVHIVAEGAGVDDGFTSYKAFVGNPPRTRWGDYGAAAMDGQSIWIASEYIAQSCTLTEYLSGAIGSCGGTRASLGNWATRISKLTP